MYRLTCVSKRKEASFLKGETMRKNQNKEHLKLVRQAVRGNPEAYGRLISEYQEYLYKMAFLYMRNQEDALDLVGSVVLKGYQNIHRLKNPEWFKTWLTRILINLAVDEKKKTLYCVDISEVQISGKACSLQRAMICQRLQCIPSMCLMRLRQNGRRCGRSCMTKALRRSCRDGWRSARRQRWKLILLIDDKRARNAYLTSISSSLTAGDDNRIQP